jgi:primosomal protein N' (replication factor Y)
LLIIPARLPDNEGMKQTLFDLEDFVSPRQPEASRALYAQVLVNVAAKSLQGQIFTYRVPEEFTDIIAVGQPVLVSFGRQDVTGFITELRDSYDGLHQLKNISDILDETPLFDAAYYDFIRWVADYYATPIPQVLECALPANLVQKTRKMVFSGPDMTDPVALEKLNREKHARKALQLIDFLYKNAPPMDDWMAQKGYSPKYLAGQLRISNPVMRQLLARLKALGIVVVENELKEKTAPKTVKMLALNPETSAGEELSKRQREILDYLQKQHADVPLQTAMSELGAGLPTLKRMERNGLLRIYETRQARDPLALLNNVRELREFKLSPSQQRAFDRVVSGDNEAPYLLYGVTGSGKTEVYMSLTRHTLEQGQSVLVMVPEIALTSQIARRFIQHFGAENIALWHSNLSNGEKADTWHKLQTGALKILIGARSAIWAPMKNLGMILIDEEHESSYKQDSPAPRYNAKTLAIELSRRTGAKLVLGSATPEVSVYAEALKNNRVLHLSERFGGREMAQVQIIDMKQERGHGNTAQLSRALEEALRANLAAGEQSIVLLNRRGFYTTIQCTLCDHVFGCPNCDVAVTYHRTSNRVHCHYCGHEDERPQYCPVCASLELNSSGVGTQRIEEEIIKKMPTARVLRLDSDVLQRKNAYFEIFEAFSAGEADILIGTQMVAKGLDVANVTLVGVISADSSFALPDYKSAERGFQLLTQVAGRAGRGEKPGRVIIQAIQTQHMVLQHSQNQDYQSFYNEEITSRESLGFPPYSQLFRFIVSSENEKTARQFIQTATAHLQLRAREANLSRQLHLMGPAPCVLPRIQGRYRFHVLVKNFAGAEGHRLIADFYRKACENRLPEDVNFILDIDAQSLL